MKLKTSALAALTAGLLLCACGTNAKYTWDNYDQSLYRYYKNAENRTGYREALTNIVARASQERPVPPGIYAELGFLELEDQRPSQALQYFKMERTNWPESTVFMTRMIRTVEDELAGRAAPNEPASSTGPAS